MLVHLFDWATISISLKYFDAMTLILVYW